MGDSKVFKVSYKISTQGPVTILAIKGRLDAIRVVSIQDDVTQLTSQGHTRIVLDLSSLDWIDSSGVRVLVMLYKQAKAQGGLVNVAGLQRQPKEIFRLLRLDSAFGIYQTLDLAIAQTAKDHR